MNFDCKKTKYSTEAFAKEDLRRFQNSGREKKPIAVYKCRCGFWHLTSKDSIKDLKAEIQKLKDENRQLKIKNGDLKNAQNTFIKSHKLVKAQNECINNLKAKLRRLQKELFESNRRVKDFERQYEY